MTDRLVKNRKKIIPRQSPMVQLHLLKLTKRTKRKQELKSQIFGTILYSSSFCTKERQLANGRRMSLIKCKKKIIYQYAIQ